MTTLLELCESGEIVLIDSGLAKHEMPVRRLYGSPTFITWLEEKLPYLLHDAIYGNLSPIEQVAALFAEYSNGDKFGTDRRFKKLNRTPSFHVWELKTDDIRIFGWCPQKDVFVCCFGDDATVVKDRSLYNSYMAQVHYFLTNLTLEEPKAITGAEYSDVLST